MRSKTGESWEVELGDSGGDDFRTHGKVDGGRD